MTVAVFTIKNHYLSHVEYITRKMGPMKHYSCRSTERTIKTFTRDIGSSTHAGVNSSNLLFNRMNMRQYGLQQLLLEYDTLNQAPSNQSYTILSLPDPFSPQLWYADIRQTIIIDNGEFLPGLPNTIIKSCLQSYYRRLFPGRSIESFNQVAITVAGKMWSDSIVYSSKLHRDKKHQETAADNFVLFEAGRQIR